VKSVNVIRRSLMLAVALSACGVQAFPERPVRIVVPFAAGGGTDTWARQFATRLASRLGQPVVVENRPAASTQVGANTVARADPDGHTLLFTSGTHIQLPTLSKSVPYDVIRDFAPIGQLGTTGLLFVVHPTMKANDIKEFIAEAKSARQWSLGTYAAGSTGDVFSQFLVKDNGLSMPVVVYKGEAPAISDVVVGQIQGGFFSIPSVKGLVQSGKLKALGSLATGHIPSLPNVRILADQGLPQFRWPGIWLSLFAPAKTPQPVLDQILAAALEVTREGDFQREWAARDVIVDWRGPSDFPREISADMKTWSDLVQSLGIQPQ